MHIYIIHIFYICICILYIYIFTYIYTVFFLVAMNLTSKSIFLHILVLGSAISITYNNDNEGYASQKFNNILHIIHILHISSISLYKC